MSKMSTSNQLEDGSRESLSAAETWVERYGDALFRFAMMRTGKEPVAEEIVQETFLAAIAGRKNFRNESTVSTWLFAILRRKIADHFRRQHRDQSAFEPSTEQPANDARRSEDRGWGADPARVYEDQEFWDTFDRCVEKLPDKLAEVFILREINQQSAKEICELLGLGATNLSMRLHRCRLALRDCLNVNWFDHEAA